MPTHNTRLLKAGFLFIFSLVCLAVNANVDSLYIAKYNQVRYFQPDSLFIKYTNSNFSDIVDDLTDYYDIVGFMCQDAKELQIKKMKEMAVNLNSKKLSDEADFMEAVFMPSNDLVLKIEALKKVEESARKRGDLFMVLREMEACFKIYWSSAQYAKAFHQAHLLDKELQKTTEEQYPRWKYCYFLIGDAYFFFQDYEKAIPYLRKALSPAKFFFDTSNLQARNTIGKYYNQRGQTDSAEYYFRSAFFSTDKVNRKSIYDAISLSNIGHSLASKSQYNSAISYMEPALSRLLMDQEYALAARISIGLGECFLAKGNLNKTRQMIDSSIVYIQLGNRGDLNKSLYFLMCKYYARKGNRELSEAYLDSTLTANKEYEKKYSSLSILRAEQEAFEAEYKAKDEKIKLVEANYQNKIFFSLIAITLSFVFLVIFIQLYRKKKSAYQALVLKSQEWADISFSEEEISVEEESIEDSISEEEFCVIIEKEQEVVTIEKEERTDTLKPTHNEKDISLIKRVNKLLIEEKIFKEFDLTLDSLAKSLDVNRNYLSKTINRTTGKNFNTFINEYRVKEAIKVMSDKKSDLISIDAIALEVGFGNRISFYQAFKKITGLSPSDFRNNKQD